MPLFAYKARGAHGNAVEGTQEAASSDAVATSLMEGGLDAHRYRSGDDQHQRFVSLEP